MKDRIAEIMNYKGLSSSAFADIIDIPRSRVSHIMSGRNKATLEVVTHIMSKFTDINILWLMTGEASMVKDSDDIYDFSKNQIQKNDQLENANSITQKEAISSENRPLGTNTLKNLTPFTQVNSSKPIDRVLIFYKDGSFKEYTPE